MHAVAAHSLHWQRVVTPSSSHELKIVVFVLLALPTTWLFQNYLETSLLPSLVKMEIVQPRVSLS